MATALEKAVSWLLELEAMGLALTGANFDLEPKWLKPKRPRSLLSRYSDLHGNVFVCIPTRMPSLLFFGQPPPRTHPELPCRR